MEFNKKYAHKNLTVSKSYVYNIIKKRKELKNRVSKQLSNNLIWSMDLTTIKQLLKTRE